MNTDDRINGWINDVVDRARERLRDELTGLVKGLTAEMAARQADAAREAEAAGAARIAAAVEAERVAAEARITEAIAGVRAELGTEHDAALARVRSEHEAAKGAERAGMEGVISSAQAAERDATLAGAAELVDAIRALDEAPSLSGILDALAERAARFTSRAAVLVHRDGKLRGWAWRGFPEAAGAAREYAADLSEAGLSGTAVRTGDIATGNQTETRGVLQPGRPDRMAQALPIRAAGDVVAVLYADNDGESDNAAEHDPSAPTGPMVPSAWPELIETLARHAGRCLEAVITRSLPELLRAGAVERARSQTLRHDDDAAERYARLLVAEIKLYHEALVDEARREGSLLRRLRPQIERAQQLYDERVAPAVRARTRYFEQELVRTLAGGDPSLLGQPT